MTSARKVSLTLIRNGHVVGNNSKSYNDKHPENVTWMRPIRDGLKMLWKSERRAELRISILWDRQKLQAAVKRITANQ